MHGITCKLNKDARQFQNSAGVTFFVDLVERNYNFKTNKKEYTNYSAALFAKDNQIEFYKSVLVEGAIIQVSGTGIIIDMPEDPKYKPKLMIQDAKLGYVNSPSQGAPIQPQQQQPPQQQAPQPQAPQQQAYQPQTPQQPEPQMQPQQQQSWPHNQ